EASKKSPTEASKDPISTSNLPVDTLSKQKTWEDSEVEVEEIRAKERRLFQVKFLRETNSDVMLWKEFVSLKQQIKCLRRKETLNGIQKSRVKGLRFGDCNSKFFHMLHTSRMRANILDSITVKGDVLDNPIDAKRAISNFFKDHFNNSMGPFFWPLKGAFKSISTLHNVIKNDTVDFFREFHVKGRFSMALNNYFIALIPKKLCLQDLNDFRPISLISSIHKVLSKVLAGRIKAVMESVIGGSHFAFMKRRQILDCTLIANEVIHPLKKSKEGGLILKVEIEKAYDTVEWIFVDRVLEEMKFG
ncbi:cysteine-rich receptor-like protein kinase, partial [Tanacetum coccineum]